MFTCFLENTVHCGGFQAPPPQEVMMLGQNGCQEAKRIKKAKRAKRAKKVRYGQYGPNSASGSRSLNQVRCIYSGFFADLALLGQPIVGGGGHGDLVLVQQHAVHRIASWDSVM